METIATKLATKARTSVLFLLLGLTVACGKIGGGISGSTDIPSSHSGTYSGRMTFSDDHTTALATTTVTDSGSSIHLSNLVVSDGGSAAAASIYGLGDATVSGNDFSGASSYSSKICGTVSVRYEGRFSDNKMSLKVMTVSGGPGAGCGAYDLEGDLRR